MNKLECFDRDVKEGVSHLLLKVVTTLTTITRLPTMRWRRLRLVRRYGADRRGRGNAAHEQPAFPLQITKLLLLYES